MKKVFSRAKETHPDILRGGHRELCIQDFVSTLTSGHYYKIPKSSNHFSVPQKNTSKYLLRNHHNIYCMLNAVIT